MLVRSIILVIESDVQPCPRTLSKFWAAFDSIVEKASRRRVLFHPGGGGKGGTLSYVHTIMDIFLERVVDPLGREHGGVGESFSLLILRTTNTHARIFFYLKASITCHLLQRMHTTDASISSMMQSIDFVTRTR